MELRKDPITRSWVVAGHPEREKVRPDPCPLCPENRLEIHPLLDLPGDGKWQVRVYPHFRPLYRIEGEPGRSADGIYDRMASIGAHEIVVETPEHTRTLEQMSDEEIERVLDAWARRIADLKRDARFKYVTVFKNQGAQAGEEWPHAHSQITATTFVPRRILYELRSAREWYRDRERCVFCDILRQEMRQAKRMVDNAGDYHALCPYASRVPYEIWLLPRTHNHQYEAPLPGEQRRNLAALLGRTLRRLLQIAPGYHLVVHTAPNTQQTKGELSDYWRTIGGDYHWHIEILPIVEQRSKSYSIKEVYFNGTLPEYAAERLRSLDPGKMTSLAATILAEPDAQRGGIIFKLVFLICFAVFLVILYLVRVPLLRFAGEFWIVDDAPENSDAIVVLSGDNFDAVRASRAAALFRSGEAPRVVATGRSLRSYASTTDLMKRDLVDHGVPAAAIIPLNHRAEDTSDEAVVVSELVASHGWKKILLVTSNYHTRRSEYIYQRTLPPGTQLRVISAPDNDYDPQSWWRTTEGVQIFFHELGGYVKALWEMRHNDVRTT